MDRIKSPRWSVIKQNRIKGTKNTIALLLKSLFSDHFLIIHRILKLEVLEPQWPLTLFYLFELIRTTKFWSKSVHSLVPILGHCANERNGPMCPSVCWPIVSKFWDQYHWPKLSVGQVGQWNHDQGIILYSKAAVLHHHFKFFQHWSIQLFAILFVIQGRKSFVNQFM